MGFFRAKPLAGEASRGVLAQMIQRMRVDRQPDGTVTIAPNPGNRLVVEGDPEFGPLVISEVEPASNPPAPPT